MRNSHSCPKCRSTDIIRIPGKIGGPGLNNIVIGLTIFNAVPVTRYLCTDCGFSEEWVDDRAGVEKLRSKFQRLS